MSALETLQAVAAAPGQVAEEWKAAGKKVVGYRCLYVPEEIIWAAARRPPNSEYFELDAQPARTTP